VQYSVYTEPQPKEEDMNICMCGYQPGAARHAEDCPYPLFRGSERDEDAWMDAREEKRDPAVASDVTVYGAGSR
jgi:hypothetical protein